MYFLKCVLKSVTIMQGASVPAGAPSAVPGTGQPEAPKVHLPSDQFAPELAATYAWNAKKQVGGDPSSGMNGI